MRAPPSGPPVADWIATGFSLNGRFGRRDTQSMAFLSAPDRLDGACDLRRVAIDGTGQDRLAPCAHVRFEPVAAGDQDGDVTGLLSPHMDGRQCVHVAGFDRRYDGLDDILVDRQAIGGDPNRADRHVLWGAPGSTPSFPAA